VSSSTKLHDSQHIGVWFVAWQYGYRRRGRRAQFPEPQRSEIRGQKRHVFYDFYDFYDFYELLKAKSYELWPVAL
jgi:hypothetical protein